MQQGVCAFAFVTFLSALAAAQTTKPLDGRACNVSTGNLSVSYIQASPIGAHPRPDGVEPPPAVEHLRSLKDKGLVAYEDYVAWGAVEREQGVWDWSQHDRVADAMKQAGLKYVVYNWVHFPPTWLRDQDQSQRTLMRCLEHGEEANYLSIFDPRTIEWYDHFYKAVHAHFGDRIDDIYACILGPYGEGNYPLPVPDWINIGHCHHGYWCGDESAIASFHSAMRDKYGHIAALNIAWGTTFASFDAVTYPPQALDDNGYEIAFSDFPAAADKRRWLDFITWYHQAIIDFAEKSIQTVLKYYPRAKVRTKPGGTAHGINPVHWGTYSPGYAKMAAKYGIVLQPADCIGAVFADKWLGTAYDFYGVKLGTEPAGGLDRDTFVRRMFSDASAGASQLFTYEFEQHTDEIRDYIHLYTGQPGDTQIAVFCPTTFYRLGGNLQPTIQAGYPLRDLCEFDVLDELLIADDALRVDRYAALIVFQSDVVEAPILAKLATFASAGGKIIFVGEQTPRDVSGTPWTLPASAKTVSTVSDGGIWLDELRHAVGGVRGVDAAIDGLWTCRREGQAFVYNSTKEVKTLPFEGSVVDIAGSSIWDSEESNRLSP